MPKALEVKPSGPPPQDPYTQLFLPLIVVLLFNCFLIQLLGQVIFCVRVYRTKGEQFAMQLVQVSTISDQS